MTRGKPLPDTLYGRQSYGRRAGRPLRPAARALLREVLPGLAIELPGPNLSEQGQTLDIAGLFGAVPDSTPKDAGSRRLWLEIGFGAGEHLAWQAGQNPGVHLIGAEVFVQGMASLLRQIERLGLKNLRLYHGDARDLLDALPPQVLDRVFILFPDPWPKTRHHKRRIVQCETLDRLAALMCDGAELRLATDDPDYRGWILERLTAHPGFEWLARAPADWRERPADWPGTRYEAKAIAQGRRPVYLRYRRRARQT